MGKSLKGVVVELKGPIKRGDGIVLDRGEKKARGRGERRDTNILNHFHMT